MAGAHIPRAHGMPGVVRTLFVGHTGLGERAGAEREGLDGPQVHNNLIAVILPYVDVDVVGVLRVGVSCAPLHDAPHSLHNIQT